MTSELKSVLLSAALAAFMLPAAAQTAEPVGPTPAPSTPPATTQPAGPGARFDNQQQRIEQGVKSGELTPQEAHRLERQERQLHREAERAKASGGGLSPQEKARIENQQNKLNNEIYNQKHDAQTTNGNNPSNPNSLAAHENRQQDRIDRGVANGSLTKGEAARLDHQEGRISHEAQQMRAADGGQLTQADRDKLQHQQARESRRIDRAKHNDRRR